jgi:hypothetical protein
MVVPALRSSNAGPADGAFVASLQARHAAAARLGRFLPNPTGPVATAVAPGRSFEFAHDDGALPAKVDPSIVSDCVLHANLIASEHTQCLRMGIRTFFGEADR